MPARRLSREEIGQRGSQIYEKNLRAELESKRHGQFVAIDVESEAFAIADEASSAAEQLWEQNPEAQVFVERIGYPAAFHAYRQCDERL